MLVLTRRLGECICINDDIKIVIQTIKGHQVRLGISAPKETVIHREEIYQKIQLENKSASDLPTHLEPMKELFRSSLKFTEKFADSQTLAKPLNGGTPT